MAIQLEYSRLESGVKIIAIIAMICGLLSGPAALGVAFYFAADGAPSTILAPVLTMMGSFVVVGTLRATLLLASPRDRTYANIGMVAVIFWCATILGLVLWLFTGIDVYY